MREVSFIGSQMKGMYRLKYLSLVFLMLVLSVISIVRGTDNYRYLIQDSKKFQLLENETFKKMKYYRTYKLIGISSQSLPRPIAMLFKPVGPTSHYSGRVDAIATLNLYTNNQGGSIFNTGLMFPYRLGPSLYLLGTLLAILLGYDSFRKREFIKFYASILNVNWMFVGVLLSRIIFLTLVISVLGIVSIAAISLSGLSVSDLDIQMFSSYLFQGWGMLIFFYLIGVAISYFKRERIAIAMLFISWFTLLFLIPGAINTVIRERADRITSAHQNKLEQFLKIVEFEQAKIKEFGGRKKVSDEKALEVMDNFLKNENLKLVELQRQLQDEIRKEIHSYFAWASYFPSLHYWLTAKEVSSNGFLNYLNYYDFLREKKQEFFRFYVDEVYRKKANKLTNFISNDDNMFSTQSLLPPTYWRGFTLTLLYSLALLLVIHSRFKATVFNKPTPGHTFKKLSLTLNPGTVHIYDVEFEEFKEQLYNVLCGKPEHFDGKMTHGGKDISPDERKKFVYVPNLQAFPGDIKTGKLMDDLQRVMGIDNKPFETLKAEIEESVLSEKFENLDIAVKANIILSLLTHTDFDIFILDEFSLGIPGKKVDDIWENLNAFKKAQQDKSIVCFLYQGGTFLEYTDFSSISFSDNAYEESHTQNSQQKT